MQMFRLGQPLMSVQRVSNARADRKKLRCPKTRKEFQLEKSNTKMSFV